MKANLVWQKQKQDKTYKPQGTKNKTTNAWPMSKVAEKHNSVTKSMQRVYLYVHYNINGQDLDSHKCINIFQINNTHNLFNITGIFAITIF